MSKDEIKRKLGPVTSQLLQRKGYISAVDVFVGLGYLTEQDVEAWRFKRVPYLEKKIRINLSKITFIMKTLNENCRNGNLKPSYTSYKSYGKDAKVDLQFSKSGLPKIEQAYATHYIKQGKLA